MARPSFVAILLSLWLIAGFFASPAQATEVQPPYPRFSVIVTELNLVHGSHGYLVMQPRLLSGLTNPFWQVDIDRTDGVPGASGGSWGAPPAVVDAVHNVTCSANNADGRLSYRCHAISASLVMPAGYFQVTVPLTRIGPLTTSYGYVYSSYGTDQFGAPDQFPVVDSSIRPTSTAEVRETRINRWTGQADLPLNLQLTPGDLVNAIAIEFFTSGTWKLDGYLQGNLRGLVCRPGKLGLNDRGNVILCVTPTGQALPAGTRSMLLQLIRVGSLPLISYHPSYATGQVILLGSRYNFANRVVDTFLIS